MPCAFQYTDCIGSCSYRVRRDRSAADPEAHSRRPGERRHHIHHIAAEEVVGTAGGTAVEEDIVVGAEGSWNSWAEEGLDGSRSLAVVEELPIVLEEDRDDLRGRDLVLDTW